MLLDMIKNLRPKHEWKENLNGGPNIPKQFSLEYIIDEHNEFFLCIEYKQDSWKFGVGWNLPKDDFQLFSVEMPKFGLEELSLAEAWAERWFEIHEKYLYKIFNGLEL